MMRKSDDFDEELELKIFTCPGCGSEQGCYLSPGKTKLGRIYRDYFCEICDALPGEPAKDERYPWRYER
jgi:Na+-translocating ferredoxin:NAD+ oxidoreductase RnfC subunit